MIVMRGRTHVLSQNIVNRAYNALFLNRGLFKIRNSPFPLYLSGLGQCQTKSYV